MSLSYYTVRISPEAMNDIDDVYRYIADKIFQPETAQAYRHGLYATIYKLYLTGGAFAVNLNKTLQRQYGSEVRTVNYKKMTIIYSVAGEFVLVHRVIAGSLIV